MRKYITVLLSFLLVGLLAACGAENTSTAPLPARLREEPLPGDAAALLTLAEGDELLDWCAGDLNGDGKEDVALIVERNEEEPTDERSGKCRELAVLLGSGNGYTLGPSSRQAVRWSEESGMAPEAHRDMSIGGSGLKVREWGTRWEEEMLFTWEEDGLMLTHVYHCNQEWNGSDLYDALESRYDLLTGEYTLTGAGGSGDCLLFQAVLDLPGPWLLEDTPGPWARDTRLSEALPPLPMRQHSPYNPENHDVTARLRYTPQEVLDHIHAEQYPGWDRVDIPWTEETRTNYSAFLGCPVPDCYYVDGENMLCYMWLDSHYSDGGSLFLIHKMMYEVDGETDYYHINDEEELP